MNFKIIVCSLFVLYVVSNLNAMDISDLQKIDLEQQLQGIGFSSELNVMQKKQTFLDQLNISDDQQKEIIWKALQEIPDATLDTWQARITKSHRVTLEKQVTLLCAIEQWRQEQRLIEQEAQNKLQEYNLKALKVKRNMLIVASLTTIFTTIWGAFATYSAAT